MASRRSRRNKQKAARKRRVDSASTKPVEAKAPSPAERTASIGQIARFCFFFAGYLALLFYLLQKKPVVLNFIEPHTALLATISNHIFNLLGTATITVGTIVRSNSFAIDIRDNCNGVFVSAIFIAAILAYPATWKSRGWGLVVGIPMIYLINLVRVITLFYVGIYFPRFFEKTHVLVWQSLVIFFAMLVWIFWIERFTGAPASRKNMVRP